MITALSAISLTASAASDETNYSSNINDGQHSQKINMPKYGYCYYNYGLMTLNHFEKDTTTVVYIRAPFEKLDSVTIEQVQRGTDEGEKTHL